MMHEIKVPALAESVSEARLLAWHLQVGQPVRRGDNLVDLETDKVTLEIPAPADGVLAEILKQEGEAVNSQELIARLDDDADTPTMGPAARALVAEHGLDPAAIPATGKAGRLLKEDVLNHLKRSPPGLAAAAPAQPGQPEVAAPSLPEGAGAPQPAAPQPEQPSPAARPERRVPMSALRRRIAERLLQSQRENASLTTFNEVNMRPVMELRRRYREEFEQRHGVRLGYMSFFAKAAVEALRRFPVVNASVADGDIVYHEYYDLSIAISAPRGLVTPVVRAADRLSLAGIESAIRELGEKARQGTLAMEELLGGTFTITNGGIFGSLVSTPILNPPQSAILGMHKIQERPVAEDGKVVIRPMMYLALSYDHRIVDGREAVQFLVAVKELLEDPARLLLQV
ncbi:MAG: 2-oxoglutarate dehydrogenase complex dihydrolipoyllysine-residue succinyltransferase [Gammaproteobacteria bacterium]|nr:2-oxoglutarate dehydrogenase complex dihydrolipoyllysine-residue succinyltransferase [Gammaproteobacteria bacterium]